MSRRFQFSLRSIKTMFAAASGATTFFVLMAAYTGSKPLVLGAVVFLEAWFLLGFWGATLEKRPKAG
jgi:hypothetical protein